MRSFLGQFRAFQGLRSTGATLWVYAVWALVGWFVLNLLALISSVVVSSFATRSTQSKFSPRGRPFKIASARS